MTSWPVPGWPRPAQCRPSDAVTLRRPGRPSRRGRVGWADERWAESDGPTSNGPTNAADTRRTLILLRHAKSAYPPGVADHERPLAPRGEREAALAGAWIARELPGIDRILCSTAERTRQTAAVAGLTGAIAPGSGAAGAGSEPDTEPHQLVTYTDDIYDAYPDELEDLIRTVDPADRTIVLVGHAPGLPGLAEDLAGSGSDESALARMRGKFPTSAIAVLSVDGEWADVGRGAVTALIDFVIPRP